MKQRGKEVEQQPDWQQEQFCRQLSEEGSELGVQPHPCLALRCQSWLGCAGRESVVRGEQSGGVSGQAGVVLAPRNA